MNRLLIIDGHNLHFQIFFGIQSRLKKKPGKVSPFGVGFTGAMKRIIRFANPTHVVVIFDGEHENPRRALFPAYKANRPDYSQLPDDENPYLQLPAVRDALDRMKIKYVETTTLEADDMIAVCCEKFRSAADIIICSHDHDFYQLLGSHVKLMNYSGKQGSYYDEKNFRDEFHISPRRFADYKALHGDKSDNIPGVRGVGSISAVRLLNRFGGIEGIIAHTPEVRQKKLRRCLVEGVDRMRLNYQLVKLGGEQYDNAELPWTLDELAYTLPDEPKKDNKRRQRGKPPVNQSGQKPKQERSKRESPQPKSPQTKPTQSLPEQTAPIPEPKPIEVKAEQTEAANVKPVESAKPRNKRRRRRSNKPKTQIQQAVQETVQANVPEKPVQAEGNPARAGQKPKPESKPEQKPEPPKDDSRPEHKNEQRPAKQPSGQAKKPRKPRQSNQKRRDRDDYPRQESAGDRILTRKQAWDD